MSLDIHTTKNELLAIFPQHSEETITRIYHNVADNLREDSHVLLLPLCIERLLELPASNNEHNRMTANLFGNVSNIFDRVEEPHIPTGLQKKANTRGLLTPGLHDSDSSNDGYNTSSSDDEQHVEHEDYRSKPRPNYREKHSRSISPISGYLSDRDDLTFTDMDMDMSTTSSAHRVITIKDSPLSNRKRKLNDTIQYDNVSNSVDLTTVKNDGNGNDQHAKKIILRDDINETANINPFLQRDGTHSLNALAPDFIPEQPDISTIKNGMTGYLEITKEKIKCIIDDVDNTYLEKLINEQVEIPIPQVVHHIVEHLLDHKDYPKVTKFQPQLSTSTFQSTSTITSSMDTFKYNQQGVTLLQNSFPKISTRVIRKIFFESSSYTQAFNALEFALESIISGEKKVEDTLLISLLKGKRSKIKITDLCSTLGTEIEDMERKRKEDMEKGDLATAVSLNTQQYDEEGQTIECGCCYNEVAFDNMVQCLEGHLFCANCLQSYSKEAVYGSGKAQLFCMTDGCDSTFPMSQMKKALQGDLLEKYMERVQDEDIKLAKLDNLIRCPGCDFAAEMDEGDKVFRCQNLSCMRETCRYCKEDWKDHFGIPCKELEKKEATNLRTTYEEKMTQAKVRKCWQCSTIFLKSDGCNKMTCRCGAKMCYICRERIIDYNHFCQDPRNPGEGCTKCKKCNLWTDPSEDDDRAVAEIKKQAEEERKMIAGDEETSKISIGPAVTVPSCSKPKMPKAFHHRQHVRFAQQAYLPNQRDHQHMQLPINQNNRWLN